MSSRNRKLISQNDIKIPRRSFRQPLLKFIKKLPQFLSILFLFLCPIADFLLLEAYSHDPFETMKAVPIVMNIVLFELLALFLLALTSSIRISLLIETVFCALYGLINYFVLEFRGTPIQPWDLLSVKTAASVAEHYTYSLDKNAALTLAGFVLLAAAAFFTKGHMKSLRLRLAVFALCGLALFGYTKMLHNETIVQTRLRLYDKLFTPTAIQKKNGTLTAFLMETQYMNVQKPEDYDKEEAKSLLSSYDSSALQDTAAQTQPNIIVIMNEAFSDPAVLGEFETNKDYMPFVRSMLSGAENTISGHMYVSVKGGNTANTEFEYLTGSSMAFLPYGSVPYQQYIHDSLPTMVSHLSDLGYRTVAMHPYGASGWERDQVYPLLGFDESYFLNHYKDAARVRKYVSDEGDYEKLIRLFEEKKDGEPLFLFNITMQNHSSYSDWADYDYFTPDITVNNSSSKLLPAYLSLIHLSDQAIEKLIGYFSQQEEDTVVVFFGDHQPTDSIVNPVLKLHGKSCAELSETEEAERFKVPFFIWANYDIEEKNNLESSPNYLGLKTLQTAGLSLPAYYSFLAGQEQSAPVVSASAVKLSDNTLTDAKEQKDLLNSYQTLQYYLLFDHKEKE